MKKLSDNIRERWNELLDGGSTDGMVSPLCDNWCLDFPYKWPYEYEDPFPPGHKYHRLSQELAMAKYCGWDPMFLSSIDSRYTNDAPKQYVRRYYTPGSNTFHTETRIETPYGDLVQETSNADNMDFEKKHWLNTKEDYQKVIWFMKNARSHIDRDAMIADGKAMVKAVGDKGILGTWIVASWRHFMNQDEMYYHIADWPDEYEEYLSVGDEYEIKLLDIYAEAGYDYIFTGMFGTEWLSPWFVEQYSMPSSKRLIAHWRKSGGKVLWHTCGLCDLYFEKGYFNELNMDILETISEPPVGNVRSLKWARELTDRNIITKGNMALDILLKGTEHEIREAVSRIKEQTKGYRHLVALSDNVLKNTPLKKCLAFVDEARRC